MIKKNHTLFLIVLSFSLGFPAWAGELKGVKVPDQKEVAGHVLFLNGMGLRQATIFRLDVYVAGLYLAEKSSDGERVLSSDPSLPKEIDLVYLRDVDDGKVKETLKNSFQQNCKAECEKLQPFFSRLLDLMGSVKKGERVNYIFLPGALGVQINDLPIQVIQGGKEFNRVVLSFWLGPNPADPELKKALLSCGAGPHCK